MPIRRELRWFYPIDWRLISRRIRFERARGRCERCGRPHLETAPQLADGRWWDEPARAWRDDRGGEAPWPDIVDWTRARSRRFVLGTAHLDHDPANSRFKNLAALCQRCHLAHDRRENLRRRRLNSRRRRAWADLFEGPHPPW